MKTLSIFLLAALLLTARTATAQQPAPSPPNPHGHRAPAAGPNTSMMMAMDSADARLDSLVKRMNHSTGDRKIAAMADVITELVAQRRAMRDRMHQMMMHGGMEMPADSVHHRGMPTPQ